MNITHCPICQKCLSQHNLLVPFLSCQFIAENQAITHENIIAATTHDNGELFYAWKEFGQTEYSYRLKILINNSFYEILTSYGEHLPYIQSDRTVISNANGSLTLPVINFDLSSKNAIIQKAKLL